ncbi:MAG: Holliday junction resolvase RuvX [Betaproteobacteria bacterium]|nr:Holliday junction resolvase RuvX [Betaproteobacteria bacterium]
MVLALDWGARRIGVAVGDLEVRVAHPIAVLQPTTRVSDLALLKLLVDEWHPVALAVGLPAAADGGKHPAATQCRAFGNRVARHFGLPLHWVDEELSSWAADQLLQPSYRQWRDRKTQLDAVAAQQILETFFERIAGPA